MIFTKERIESVNIDSLINGKIVSGRLNELLLIIPTKRKARNLKKEIIEGSPNKAAAGINIETLGTISSKLLQPSKSFRPLSEAASTILIKQSAAETTLQYFSLYKHDIPFGTLERIRNVISEYKNSGVTPDFLLREAGSLDATEKLKALDISKIYRRYLEKCLSLNALETGDVYYFLNQLEPEEFKTNFHKFYPAVNLIIVTGFDEFTSPEIRILDSLAGLPDARLLINFDYYERNKLIFGHLEKCYDKLCKAGFNVVIDSAEEQRSRFSRTIREKLFINPGRGKKLNYARQVEKIEAYSPEEEVELIAAKIKKLIELKNIAPDRICVVFNLIDKYSTLIRDLFSKNGIPFNLSDRVRLDSCNGVIAVINFLEIAENDYYYKNIFRALGSGFLSLGAIDFANLLWVAAELKVVSGKQNWIAALKDLIETTELSSEDELEEAERKRLNKALEDFQNLSSLLKPFEDKNTIPEFREKLFEFVSKSGLPFKLIETEYNREKNVRGFTKFIEIVNEVFDLLEKEHGEEARFHIKFFMDNLRTLSTWGRFNVKEKSNYGVLVTSLEEIRGLRFDTIFIGGLIDGNLPTKYYPEVFSSGNFKKLAATHQSEERNKFYQALCGWSRRLFLSCPLTESGRETVVSTYLKDFESLFEISSSNRNDLSDTICSVEDLQVLFGEKMAGDLEELAGFAIEKYFPAESVCKSIEIERQRAAGVLNESVYNGFIIHPDVTAGDNYSKRVKERLDSFALKQYSISQLETYSRCPFKFFLERVLNVETIEEPSEDIEAIEMGRLLHSILFKFYSEVSLRNWPVNEEFKPKLLELIFSIAEEEFNSANFKSPFTFFEQEKIFGLSGRQADSILGRFIQYEIDHTENYVPRYFEVSFGTVARDESDKVLSDFRPVIAGEISLRGKIDRVELNKADDTFNIVDYKLNGTKPTLRQIKEGISLQLPVYLYAASVLLERLNGKKYTPNEMVIYSLKYSADDFGRKVISVKNSRHPEIKSVMQLIDITIGHIQNFVRSIQAGKFHLSQHDDRENIVCSNCLFKPVCRISSLV